MTGLIWLASYPKSGNTWLRLFLDQLETPEEAISINDLRDRGQAFRRALIDDGIGVDSAFLSQKEVEDLLPAYLRHAAEHGLLGTWQKTHGAYFRNRRGEAIFDAAVTRGAVLIVRNPLDVTVSYANHLGCSIDRCIEVMGHSKHGLLIRKRTDRVGERLGSWRENVSSWLAVDAFPVHLMRYEDMVGDPLPTFRSVARFLDLPTDAEAVATALERVSFDRLQEQERKTGFVEGSPHASAFFRKGRVGDWRNHLAPAQVEAIVRRDGELMKRLGYLDARGELTV